MQYYLSKIIQGKFKQIIDKVTELLKEEGFGILTEINVKDTLKKKLDVDYKEYVILGACNPSLALRAFQAEDKIGTLLPCNVSVIDQGDGNIEVAIMDAETLMSPIGNPELKVLAKEVAERMNRVLMNLH
ncbi:MAG: DUF302 domain-containing protein [Bacteroidales bacterium]|nr:DUF302 domain-containing protein [Bacteroidales bacterium]